MPTCTIFPGLLGVCVLTTCYDVYSRRPAHIVYRKPSEGRKRKA
jgi:hypothetical protein